MRLGRLPAQLDYQASWVAYQAGVTAAEHQEAFLDAVESFNWPAFIAVELSDDALLADLLLGLFASEPMRRLTAANALNHPYLRDVAAVCRVRHERAQAAWQQSRSGVEASSTLMLRDLQLAEAAAQGLVRLLPQQQVGDSSNSSSSSSDRGSSASSSSSNRSSSGNSNSDRRTAKGTNHKSAAAATRTTANAFHGIKKCYHHSDMRSQ